MQRSWIVIDRSAVTHNINEIIRYSGLAEIGLVVKANAYGHGLEAIVSIIRDDPRIKWLLVAGTCEALKLRTLGWRNNILAMAYHDADATEVIEQEIVIAMSNFDEMQSLMHAARLSKKSVRAHLKIETGMHRRGFTEEQLKHYFPVLNERSVISLEGSFTHLCNTNNQDTGFTYAQVERFNRIVQSMGKQFPAYHHVLASGSLWMSQKYHMVRVGTALYGSWKSQIQRARLFDMTLHPVMRWYTTIVEIKIVEEGESIGYDAAFRATQRMRVALLPVGYADGYQRRLAGLASVMVRGYYASILGIISMNMMTIDVSHIPECKQGDEVLLIGPYDRISPYDLAQLIHTNPNEITTSLSSEIPRFVQ